MSKLHITTSVNGQPEEVLCEPHQSLLDVLRDELGLTGTKEGCSTGDCGACTVTLDGRLVCSCLVLAPEAEGKEVGTIEGVANPDGCMCCSRSFWSMRHCSAAFVRPDLLWRQKLFWSGTPIQRNDYSILACGQPLSLHGL
ncbi:MAG: hypothetical protein Ct9H300mP8_10710 [Gammaproteobacteria bacterium]|nr:MAG: hypothetical protein Ct9H300mP8_10710 [Gammaproteobacteria bacterium]